MLAHPMRSSASLSLSAMSFVVGVLPPLAAFIASARARWVLNSRAPRLRLRPARAGEDSPARRHARPVVGLLVGLTSSRHECLPVRGH